jgi:thioesterase DpgC
VSTLGCQISPRSAYEAWLDQVSDGPSPDSSARIRSEWRPLRAAFMREHAESVYGLLTEDFTRRLRLRELVSEAAAQFPGLVPDERQIAAEERKSLRDKEGQAIDLGIFFSSIFLSPRAGNHLLDVMLGPTDAAAGVLDEFLAVGELHLERVHLKRRGNVAHLVISDPTSLNAEDRQLVDDMETAIDVALLAPEVSVGVLRGGIVESRKHEGKRVFCSGINLKRLLTGEIPFLDFLLRREVGLVEKLRRGILVADRPGEEKAVQKPWVGVVDGFAIGGGTQLLLVLDWVIAEEGAYFSLPAAQEGIIPGAAPFRLGRFCGPRIARQLILGERRVAASDPLGSLFCDVAVPTEEIDAALAEAVTRMAGPAVGPNRKLLVEAEEPREEFREFIANFALAQAQRFHSPDLLAKLEDVWAS